MSRGRAPLRDGPVLAIPMSAGERLGIGRSLLVVIVALLTTVPGIWRLPPTDRDESRYVQATKQMVETSDAVDIRFQDTPRYNKPVGIYWMQAAAVEISGFGDKAPIWVYRLVSVLGIVSAAIGIAWTGARLFGRDAGLIAGLMLAGIFAAAFEGRIAKTDAMVLGLVVLAQGALAQIYVAHREKRIVDQHLPWVFWLAQGLGILVKGPIAPLASGLTILALIAVDREWRWLGRLKAGRGILLAALIVLPWLLLISWKSGGAFWQQSVGKDMLGKIAEGQESHWGPPGYYMVTYCLYVWPFALLALDAGLKTFNQARFDPRLLFCLCWYLPFWLVFEAIGTKLPHYVMPAYPALALLVGWALTRPLDASPLRRWQTVLWWLAAFGQILVTLGLAILAIAAPLALGDRLSFRNCALAGFAILTGYLALPNASSRGVLRIGAAAGSAAATYALMFAAVLPGLTSMWLSPQIAEAVRAKAPCSTPHLVSVGYEEPSLVFLTDTTIKFTDVGGAARHLADDPSCGLALLPTEDGGALDQALLSLGQTAIPLSSFEGINYSAGREVALTLYRLAP